MRLDRYASGDFDRGASRLVEALWLLLGSPLVRSGLPGSGWRRRLLALFGARTGKGVVIKPGVQVKFPWRLTLGDHCWLGENVWLDNLAPIAIGAHACVSQGAYLCTGSHDWSRETFDLRVAPIAVGDGAWIAAGCRIGPGVQVGDGAVLQLGAVVTADVAAGERWAGNPARCVGTRQVTGGST